MADPIRIAIIDDHPLFRDGLVETIKAAGNMLVVAEAGTAEDARRIAAQTQPDIMLLDICIPGDGIQAARAIQQAPTSVKIVMLTASEDDDHVSDAIDAGAKGYLLKGISGRELIGAIESVHKGASYITPQLAMRLLMETKARPAAAEIQDWTPHELKILAYLSAGRTNDEIAASIGLNLRATKRRITKTFRKLGVRNRVEALLAVQKLKLKPSL